MMKERLKRWMTDERDGEETNEMGERGKRWRRVGGETKEVGEKVQKTADQFLYCRSYLKSWKNF